MERKPLDFHPGGKTLKIRAARLYSDIFSPPSLFAIFAFIISWAGLPLLTGFLHAAIFGVLTSLLPMIYILTKLRQGKLSDIHLSQPGERTMPYLLGAFGSFLANQILRWMGTSSIFLNFTAMVVIGLLALALINTQWMISAHTASITAVTVFIGVALNLTTAFALSPLILSTFWIRYYLKRHTIAELISGIILGASVVVGASIFGIFIG